MRHFGASLANNLWHSVVGGQMGRGRAIPFLTARERVSGYDLFAPGLTSPFSGRLQLQTAARLMVR